MGKYQVTIHFDLGEDFMRHVPEHRVYINKLLNTNVIEQYAVSVEAGKGWITINAESKEEVESYLQKSPLHRFWVAEIDELFVFDSQTYRFPRLVPN